jgi:hypothetical protein
MISFSENDSTCSPVEEIVFIDSCNVAVPISYIRLTNEKLIERKYLIKISNEKDSVIDRYRLYCIEQRDIIEDIQRDIQKANEINNKLQTKLNKEKQKTIIISSVTGGVIVGSLITIVALSLK